MLINDDSACHCQSCDKWCSDRVYNLRTKGANIHLIGIEHTPEGTLLYNELERIVPPGCTCPPEFQIHEVDVLQLVNYDGDFRVLDTLDYDYYMGEYQQINENIVPIDNYWIEAMIREPIS